MKKDLVLKPEDFGKEYSGKYVFETISWGTSNQISSDCTKIEPASKKTSVDLREMQARMLDATMVERPAIITLEKLKSDKGIPVALGEFLMSVADYVNGYSEEERDKVKKLKGQLGVS